MATKVWKNKQQNTKLPSRENQNAVVSVQEIKVVSYPDHSNSKPAYFENPDIPWIQSPKINEPLNELVIALAHEMRNPLAVISSSTELLNNKAEKDDDLKICVDMIRKSTVRINDLIIRLLAVQQFMETKENTCSIAAIFNDVLEIVADHIRLKGITVIRDFYKADSVLVLDKSKLQIAFTNIITNAIEAMPSVNGVLRLSIKENNNHYSVRIEDNGCGMSKHHLQSIFERGFTEKLNGSGYGLSITNSFLQANNVVMKVKSEEGKGTIFLLLFN